MARRRKRLFHPLSWALLRAPLLPVEVFLALAQEPGQAQTSSATGRRPETAQAQMALMVGAGHLAEATRAGDDAAREVSQKRLRYQIRMSTRPTPYGMFAGVALCQAAALTALAIDERKHARAARPDMEWLLSFIAALEAREDVLRHLSFTKHPMLYRQDGRVALDNPVALREGASPVSVAASPFVLATLEIARERVRHDTLVQRLMHRTGADIVRARSLIRELVNLGLLLSDLRPPLTGGAPAKQLLDRLRSLPDPPAPVSAFSAALASLDEWVTLDACSAAQVWPTIDASFAALQAGPKARIQVDLALGLSQPFIGTALLDEAADIAELLLRLSPQPHGSPSLQRFRSAFVARYGTERQVPLLELLHPRTGLGMPSGQGVQYVDERRLARRQSTLQTLAQEALVDRREEIELDDALIERLALWEPQIDNLPVSVDLCLMVLADSPAAINEGRFRVVVGPNVGAQQAGRYLGRFAGLLGPRADAALREAADAEQRHASDAVWAESVHLPTRLRSANVAIRPASRTHEIALGVAPGVPPDQVIALDELHVGVRSQRLCLYWREREVRVCAGHMLTPLHAPQVIRFLEELGQDGVAQLSGFDWGPAAGFLFLPRIVRGCVVLAPARWRISCATFGGKKSLSETEFASSLQAYRERWRMPRFVYLVEGDNRLLLDLENRAQADQIRLELARRDELSTIVIQEALPGPQHAWVPTMSGHALVEFVVPLVRQAVHTVGAPPSIPPSSASAYQPPADAVLARMRPPGTDWLFVKLYVESERAEALLAGTVRQFCNAQLNAGRCASWFFIRYSDPDPHLRIRLRGDPNRLTQDLLPEVCAWGGDLMAAGQVSRFGFDTYERELERYGGPSGIAWAETFFAADSSSVADMLNQLDGGDGFDRLSLLAISVDRLLEDLGLDETARLTWCKQQASSRHIGGSEYRERKAALRAWYAPAARVAFWPEWLPALLDERSRTVRPLGQRWWELQRENRLGTGPNFLLASLVHMHCNRFAGLDSSIEARVIGMLLRLRASLAKAPVSAAVWPSPSI